MTTVLRNTDYHTPCHCGNWLNHWERHSGLPLPSHCAALYCNRAPTIGALVQKLSFTDTQSYIVPLCSVCGKRYGEFLTINDDVPLVLAVENNDNEIK